MHVGVAGAGIAGLSAALSLRNAGIDVTVYERAADARSVQVGGALTMFPNAVRAMDILGVGDDVRDAGADFEAAEFRRANGDLLARWPVGEMGRRHGGSGLFIRRGQLHRFLFAALGDDAVVTGSEVVGFEERPDDVAVHLADGNERTCDVLVGADGLASRVRTVLHPGTESFYSGYTGWHGEIPRGDLPANILRALFGRGDRFVFYPADRNDLAWHAVANAPEGEQDPPGEAKARLLTRFDGWPEPTIEMIERTPGDRIRRADTYAGPVLRRWTKGRVTLAGDAAHPTTFNVGQGAAQAMEDGIVLARCLAATRDPLAGLRDYESRRRKRAASFQQLAYRTGRMAALEGRFACAVRDVVMRQVLNGVGRRQVERETAAYKL